MVCKLIVFWPVVLLDGLMFRHRLLSQIVSFWVLADNLSGLYLFSAIFWHILEEALIKLSHTESL